MMKASRRGKKRGAKRLRAKSEEPRAKGAERGAWSGEHVAKGEGQAVKSGKVKGGKVAAATN
jgi:hypothetical protein